MRARRSRLLALARSLGIVFAPAASPPCAPPRASASPSPALEESDSPPRAMTLEEALAFARTHHLRVTAARQRVKAAEREADVASAQWLPRVGAMAQVVGSTANNSTTTLLGTATVDLPRIGATPITRDYDYQPYPSTAAAIGARQQLYDFGRVAAERAAAELAATVEQYRASGSSLDVDFTVRQSYYAVLAAVAIADASHAAFQRATSHRDLAR